MERRPTTTADEPPQAAGTSPRLGVRFIGHATVRLDFADTRVLTDPFLRATLGPLERHGATPDPDAVADTDIVVISHGHLDHFDRWSLRAIPGRPVIVVPRGLGVAASQVVRGDVVEVEAGDAIDIDGTLVTAVPARHWISPGAPRARPIGYVLERGGRRVYFAGDTGRFDAMASLVAHVDVALLPVWTWGPHLGPGHLGPRTAAEVLRELAPGAAVPIHWGTLYPRRLHHLWKAPLFEPGDRFATHAAETAPAVDVRVLRPGSDTTFDTSRPGGTPPRGRR